jgi:hypothetical protein
MVAMTVPTLSAAASHLELHVLISGTQFTFIDPLP